MGVLSSKLCCNRAVSAAKVPLPAPCIVPRGPSQLDFQLYALPSRLSSLKLHLSAALPEELLA
jgi:hypothetical protein